MVFKMSVLKLKSNLFHSKLSFESKTTFFMALCLLKTQDGVICSKKIWSWINVFMEKILI